MIAFLLMVVLGFSVPLFQLGGNTDQTPQQVQPRLCQNDAECYLTCNDKPLEVLCQQNLCVQNSCTEFNLFPYQQQPQEIALSVTINGVPISLQNSNPQDFFVRFNDDIVQLHAPRVSLSTILEKAGIILLDQCLMVTGKQYCTDSDSTLNITANGENTYQFEQYIPQEGDEIRIVYS